MFEKHKDPRATYLFLAWAIVLVFVLLELYLVQFYLSDYGQTLAWTIKYLFKQVLFGWLLIVYWVIPGYDSLSKPQSLLFKVLGFTIHGLVFTTIYFLALIASEAIFSPNNSKEELIKGLMRLYFTESHNTIKTYLAFMVILYGFDQYHKNLKNLRLQKDLESEIMMVKLDNLNAQLQPHFLFNTLNTAVALIDENRV
ncbi:MAG: histidine kinase, partial [Bacteroidota bacterium]